MTPNTEARHNIMLDSGAFSAWNQGITVNLDAYIEFSLEWLNQLAYIVNLDVIPARPGVKRISLVDVEKSASEGWANYERMLAAGIPRDKLIHVFHQNEDMKWLQRMVEEIPYIGLSPANDRTTEEKNIWLDQCMDIVCDKDGMPKVKFHGFAVTSERLMIRYPWYSVDSASWVMMSRQSGAIYMPRRLEGQWVFAGYKGLPAKYTDAWVVAVSSRNPGTKDAGKHFTTFSKAHQALILEYLEYRGTRMGKSEFHRKDWKKYEPKEDEDWVRGTREADGTAQVERILEEGVCNSYKLRDELNIKFFEEFAASIPPWPIPYKREGTLGFGIIG